MGKKETLEKSRRKSGAKTIASDAVGEKLASVDILQLVRSLQKGEKSRKSVLRAMRELLERMEKAVELEENEISLPRKLPLRPPPAKPPAAPADTVDREEFRGAATIHPIGQKEQREAAYELASLGFITWDEYGGLLKRGTTVKSDAYSLELEEELFKIAKRVGCGIKFHRGEKPGKAEIVIGLVRDIYPRPSLDDQWPKVGWEGGVATKPEDVVKLPHTCMRSKLLKSMREVYPSLTDAQIDSLLEDAERLNEEGSVVRIFNEKSKASPEPLLFKDRPKGMTFEAFMRQEYRDKGMIRTGFTLKDLRARDPELAAAYGREWSRKGFPEDIQVEKLRSRTTKRERAQTQRSPSRKP